MKDASIMFDMVFFAMYASCCALLWVSTFGYIFILRMLARRPSNPSEDPSDLPAITVAIPILNEGRGITRKLEDMERCDYPRDRMKLLVIDGGSGDDTIELIRKEISRGKEIDLICLRGARGKTDQVNHILGNPGEDIIIFTDSDSRLEPSCIRKLVLALIDDPKTALAGAAVEPESSLPEEKIHWRLLNTMWWLEGEILSSAGISGVCYAVNRSVFPAIAHTAVAEDIHMGLGVGARGYRVRIIPGAKAVELRVPQTPREFLQFRRRRGASYVHELLFPPDHPHPPFGWKLARFFRLWQFSWIPWLGMAAGIASGFMLLTRYRLYPLLFSAVFIFSVFLLPLALLHSMEKPRRDFAAVSGLFRYAALIFVSLLSINKKPSHLGPLGGKEEKHVKIPST